MILAFTGLLLNPPKGPLAHKETKPMNQYEMMVILRPDLPEEQVQQEVTKYKDFLAQQEAQNVEVKVWGKRRLAYPINRFVDGIYALFHFQGAGQQIAPLERSMRLSDEVLRFLTLKLETPKATPEAAPTEVPAEA